MAEPKFAVRAENHPLASLTSEEVRAVKALGAAGMRPSQLSRISGIPYHTVYAITTGRRWASTEIEEEDIHSAIEILKDYKRQVISVGSGLFANMVRGVSDDER